MQQFEGTVFTQSTNKVTQEFQVNYADVFEHLFNLHQKVKYLMADGLWVSSHCLEMEIKC